MADHQRKLIRAATVVALIGVGPSYATAAGTNVFPTRMIPYKSNELPALSVYTLSEVVDPDSRSTAPQELARTLELAVEGCLEAKATVDDDMDALALQIEDALMLDDTLGGAVSWLWLHSTEMSVLEKGDQRIGVVRLVFRAEYRTDAPPDGRSLPDDLHTVTAQENLGNAQELGNRANDTIDVTET